MITTNVANGTTYITKEFTANGNTWSVLFVHGVHNYVSVRKETNNPFKSGGKDFKNFDAAVMGYKSGDMKAQLLLAEVEMKQFINLIQQ